MTLSRKSTYEKAEEVAMGRCPDDREKEVKLTWVLDCSKGRMRAPFIAAGCVRNGSRRPTVNTHCSELHLRQLVSRKRASPARRDRINDRRYVRPDCEAFTCNACAAPSPQMSRSGVVI